jgi:hypothetical protein
LQASEKHHIQEGKMKAIFKIVILGIVGFFIFGCSQNYYNVPREQYGEKVKVLGVAPIFVDADSDIRHPEKDSLVALVKDFNRLNEKKLAEMIKQGRSHYDVRFLPGEADPLFSSLYYRRERRDDAGIVYNKYFYKADPLREYVKSNYVDAVMLVVVSGVTRPDKVYSSNLLDYLSTNYNFLIMTAQILDADGTILWEYPNFRQNSVSFPAFVALQYPDFSEANANLSDKVEIKFKTLPGLKRTLEKKEKDLWRRDQKVSESYHDQFEDMVSLMDRDKTLLEKLKK